MRDSQVQNARKKYEIQEMDQLKEQKEELKDILLVNIENEYINNFNFSHYDENYKIILIEKSINQLGNMYKLIKNKDYYYYFLLSKYDAIGNKSKKYALNSKQYKEKSQKISYDLNKQFDDISNKIMLKNTNKKNNSLFYLLAGWILK